MQYRSVTDGQTDIPSLAIPALAYRYANALVKSEAIDPSLVPAPTLSYEAWPVCQLCNSPSVSNAFTSSENIDLTRQQ